MADFRKLKIKKLLRNPIAVLILVVFSWPFFWLTASAVTVASYTMGLTTHLGASRGYFDSNKLSNFVSLPFDRINLSYGYGSRRFWVSEGTEIYLKYSAVNYGEETMRFVITDYHAGLKATDESESATIRDSGSGILSYKAKQSGFYKVMILPRALAPAGDDVRYSYSMSWGTRGKSKN